MQSRDFKNSADFILLKKSRRAREGGGGGKRRAASIVMQKGGKTSIEIKRTNSSIEGERKIQVAPPEADGIEKLSEERVKITKERGLHRKKSIKGVGLTRS